MEELISGVIYILFVVGVVKILRKTVWKNSSSKGTTTGSFSANGTMPTITSQPTFTTQQVRPAQSSAMPHVHKPANQYESNRKARHYCPNYDEYIGKKTLTFFHEFMFSALFHCYQLIIIVLF